MYTSFERDKFIECFGDWLGQLPRDQYFSGAATTWCMVVDGILSVGGGIGFYVHVPDARYPRVPESTESTYKIGYLAAKPKPNRHTVPTRHWTNPYTGQEDEKTHCLGYYYGAPLSKAEERSTYLAISRGPMAEHWFLDAYSPLPPAEIFERGLNKLDAHRYSNYLYGPGYSILSATKCRHEYYLTDSCPGCDADEENHTGPWTGVTELGYV